MKFQLQALLLSSVITFAAAAPSAAQQVPRTYVITSRSESAGGVGQLREVLSLARDGSRSRLRVSSNDGSMFSVPVVLDAQGEIASNSQDRSVTCYNMAMNVLAHQDAPWTQPAWVFVQFDASVVQIPLRVRTNRARGTLRDLALAGGSTGVLRIGDGATAAGILINANVSTKSGELLAATFDEIHYVGAPAHVIGRSTCTLERARDKPPAADISI